EVLGDDPVLAARQPVQDRQHAPRGRVLDRDHEAVDLFGGERLESRHEARETDPLVVGEELPARPVGIREGLALVTDPHRSKRYRPARRTGYGRRISAPPERGPEGIPRPVDRSLRRFGGHVPVAALFGQHGEDRRLLRSVLPRRVDGPVVLIGGVEIDDNRVASTALQSGQPRTELLDREIVAAAAASFAHFRIAPRLALPEGQRTSGTENASPGAWV